MNLPNPTKTMLTPDDAEYELVDGAEVINDIDGDLLVHPKTGEIVQLNATASIIASACEGGRTTVADVVDSLHHQHPETDMDHLREDVAQFLQRLLSKGFVQKKRTT